MGDHRGFLTKTEHPFPNRPDYQPNRVPKRPNTTVNKFCILTCLRNPLRRHRGALPGRAHDLLLDDPPDAAQLCRRLLEWHKDIDGYRRRTLPFAERITATS